METKSPKFLSFSLTKEVKISKIRVKPYRQSAAPSSEWLQRRWPCHFRGGGHLFPRSSLGCHRYLEAEEENPNLRLKKRENP